MRTDSGSGGMGNRYPHFSHGTVISLSPRGGKVHSPVCPQPIPVVKATAQALRTVDGGITFSSLLASIHREVPAMEELLHVTADLAVLCRQKVLAFSDAPSLTVPEFRGSFDIHYPENLEVELTSACNLRCGYCYRDASYGRDNRRLSTESLLAILDALRERGLNSVELTGGEPFLHPDFSRILEYCTSSFALIGVLTNGTLATTARIRPLLPHKNKLVVSVSLDSHRPDVHDRRRGQKGAFERTVKAIRLLASSGLLTRVSMSVDEENWPDIEDTLLFAKSLGASSFVYAPILPFGRGMSDFRFWSAPPTNVIETEAAIHEKYRGFLDLLPESTIARLDQPGACGAGHRVYALDPNGYVRPCVTFATDRAVLGCLATESPEQVFSRALSRRFETLTAPSAESCEDCPWSQFCRNCALRALVASEWVGRDKCHWLSQPLARQWYEEVHKHSTGPTD